MQMQTKKSLPKVYGEAELNALEQFIEARFGAFPNVFHEIVSPDIHVDIAIVEPTNERNYYTLITMGMGARRMRVPKALPRRDLARAELVVCLPPDWKINDPSEAWYWPLQWLKILARLPAAENTWLGGGHTIANGGPFAGNTALCGVLLANPALFFPAGEASACALPNGEKVNFYQMIPLYEEEMDFARANCAASLMERLGEAAMIVDVRRPNVCASENSRALPANGIRELLTGWQGADGCFATNRIVKDGRKVGYMYRETPDKECPDSGWRFLAGDETDDYMDDPKNADVYKLNTICNYDPDILPLLRAPVGTAYCRDARGAFVACEFPGLDET